MKTSDFDYHLPESSIAQTPAEPRDSSRLLVLHRDTGELEHRIFREIIDYFKAGDLLVLNQTRVIPARIYARKETGGRVELLLLRRRDELTWEALVGGKGLRVGTWVHVESEDLSSPQGARLRDIEKSSTSGPTGMLRKDVGVRAEIIEILNGSERLIKFSEPIEPYFSQVGNVPLPPYIHEKLNDPERYQTVYAKEPGSAAAPTAGLHFTPRLLDELQTKGVKIAYVTLHVGLDTFAPVTEENPEEHKIHSEWCQVSQETADLINQTKKAGGRVIASGTTSVRTLESRSNRTKCHSALRRRDLSFHHSGLSIQNRGRADHEFPFAEIFVDYAGQCFCRTRKDFGNVSDCRGRRLSFLFVWGCDVDFIASLRANRFAVNEAISS